MGNVLRSRFSELVHSSSNLLLITHPLFKRMNSRKGLKASRFFIQRIFSFLIINLIFFVFSWLLFHGPLFVLHINVTILLSTNFLTTFKLPKFFNQFQLYSFLLRFHYNLWVSQLLIKRFYQSSKQFRLFARTSSLDRDNFTKHSISTC